MCFAVVWCCYKGMLDEEEWATDAIAFYCSDNCVSTRDALHKNKIHSEKMRDRETGELEDWREGGIRDWNIGLLTAWKD